MEEHKKAAVPLSDISDYLQEHDRLKKIFLDKTGINDWDVLEESLAQSLIKIQETITLIFKKNNIILS